MEKALKNGKVFSFLSPKGGSGKTITAITLSFVLSGLNKRVLIVDSDASTNGLSLFYLNEIASHKAGGTRTSLCGTLEAEGDSVIDTLTVENGVDIAPSSFTMNQTESTNLVRFRERLVTMLATWRTSYDYIFIDAQAGTDAFAEIAATLADEVVVVSEYDPISSRGVERLKIIFERAFTDKPVWILYNKILPEFVQGVGDFLAIAGFLRPIPWDAEVVRAYVRRRSAIDMQHGNLHTLAAMDCAVSLLGRSIDREIEDWKQARVDSVKLPASLRLLELDGTIAHLEQIKVTTKSRASRFRKSLNAILIFYLIGIVAAMIFLSTWLTQALFVDGVLFAVLGVLFLAWVRAPFMEKPLERIFGDFTEEDLDRRSKESDRAIGELKEERQRVATFATIKDMTDLWKVKNAG